MTWKNILGNQMIILLFYTVIEAHARLTDPIPWNQNPSKTSPCGGISSPDIINSFSAGTLINIGWQVIAGDGAGDVIQSIDISGGTNFTSMNTLGTTSTVGYYNFSLVIPNVTCNPYCSIQIKSSNWYSCFSFTTNTTNTTVLPPVCTTANNLQFCTMLNTYQVWKSGSKSLIQQDGNTNTYYQSLITNPNVFAKGNDRNCQSLFKFYLCQTSYTWCGNAIKLKGISQEYCLDTMNTCGLTESHAQLFNCSQLVSNQQMITNAASDIFKSIWLTIFVLIIIMIEI